ncbi:hypothetical protein ACH5RR_003031 [Cinchona calisaya]|uniref:Uncharacterized protein n=1 Tax=Cinchona calisaya TaxID=153742 RepID=A0ABD3ATN8_9GENT
MTFLSSPSAQEMEKNKICQRLGNRQDQESSTTDLALNAKLGNEEVQANSKMSPNNNNLSLWARNVDGHREGNRSKNQQSKNKLGYRKLRILPPTLRQPCGDITNWM